MKTKVYLTVEPQFDRGGNLTSARVVKATAGPPVVTERSAVVVKLVLDVEDEAFAPLAPPVEVAVSAGDVRVVAVAMEGLMTDPTVYDAAPTMVEGCSCNEDGIVTEKVRMGDKPCDLIANAPDRDNCFSACPCRCHMVEPPGYPCQYCGEPVPMDGSACPRCWVPATEEHLDSLYREAWLGHEHREGGTDD